MSNPLGLFFWLLMIAAFGVEIFAFVDAVRHRTDSYVAAGKQTKNLWLIILGIALVMGLGSATGYLGVFNFLTIAAFIAALIYLVDVRPRLREVEGKRGGQGPYGPW